MIYRPTKNNTPQELVREAILITSELGNVVFVGAVAVYLYTRTNRPSRDLDFAVASKITNEELRMKGYEIFEENGKEVKRSPRRYKVDIFDKDVSGIPVEKIIETAKEIKVEKRGTMIKIASLEALIVAKHTASRPSRPQDDDDLYEIAQTNFNKIDKESLKQLVDEHKFHVILETMTALQKIRP